MMFHHHHLANDTQLNSYKYYWQNTPFHNDDNSPLSTTRVQWQSCSISLTFEMTKFSHCIALMQVFRDNKIDGGCLPLLTESHLTTGLGLKLGPALKLLTALRCATFLPCFCFVFALFLLAFKLGASFTCFSLWLLWAGEDWVQRQRVVWSVLTATTSLLLLLLLLPLLTRRQRSQSERPKLPCLSDLFIWYQSHVTK